MKFRCKICGEWIPYKQLLEHIAGQHKDDAAKEILDEIKRITDPSNKSYGQVVDELGVRWLVIGRDLLDKVMIRSDLKMVHVWVDGGMFEIEATKIGSRFGVYAEIKDHDKED